MAGLALVLLVFCWLLVGSQHVHVKFELSNIHAFVPIWMASIMLRNFRPKLTTVSSWGNLAGGWKPPCPAPVFRFLVLFRSLWFLFSSPLLCPPSLLSYPGKTLVRPGGFWRFFRVRSNPLRDSGCRVSKTGVFLRLWCARICAHDSFCLVRPSPDPVPR